MVDSAHPEARVLAPALRASQVLDIVRFVEVCVEGLGELVRADGVHAYLRAAAGKELELRTSWPPSRGGSRRAPAVIDGRTIREAGPRGAPIEPNRLRPSEAPWSGDDPGALFLLPIGQGRQAFGVFLVSGGSGRGAFTGAEIGTMRVFLSAVEPAVRNIATVIELREISLRDDITQCYNRRYFETSLAEEIARAARFKSSLSILFLDMDNLKEVNNLHGHSAGSRTLREVAQRVNAGIRNIDKMFRFGGDEFCIVLPETDVRGAREVGTRVREIISAEPLLVPDVGGVPMTASIGIATFPENGRTGEELVLAADRAMQRVKNSGKNGVGVAGAETVLPREARPRSTTDAGRGTNEGR